MTSLSPGVNASKSPLPRSEVLIARLDGRRVDVRDGLQPVSLWPSRCLLLRPEPDMPRGALAVAKDAYGAADKRPAENNGKVGGTWPRPPLTLTVI